MNTTPTPEMIAAYIAAHEAMARYWDAATEGHKLINESRKLELEARKIDAANLELHGECLEIRRQQLEHEEALSKLTYDRARPDGVYLPNKKEEKE